MEFSLIIHSFVRTFVSVLCMNQVVWPMESVRQIKETTRIYFSWRWNINQSNEFECNNFFYFTLALHTHTSHTHIYEFLRFSTVTIPWIWITIICNRQQTKYRHQSESERNESECKMRFENENGDKTKSERKRQKQIFISGLGQCQRSNNNSWIALHNEIHSNWFQMKNSLRFIMFKVHENGFTRFESSILNCLCVCVWVKKPNVPTNKSIKCQ